MAGTDTKEARRGYDSAGATIGPETLVDEGLQQVYSLTGLARVVKLNDEMSANGSGDTQEGMDFDGNPQELLEGIRYTTNSTEDYLRAIGKVPLLNAEQEVVLAKAIEVGVLARDALRGSSDYMIEAQRDELRRLVEDGEAAYETFISANLRLVVSVAKRYAGKGVPFLDLIQEGNLGLIRAVEKFDYKKGYKFSTYAVGWLTQAMHHCMANADRMIYLPMHVVEKNNAVAKTEKILHTWLGRKPTDEEMVADGSGITMHDMELFHITKQQNPLSFDTPIGDDATLGDIVSEDKEAVPVEDRAIAPDIRAALLHVVETLPERESRVVMMRLGLDGSDPMGFREIGQALGVTRERARQIEAKAMSRLRHPSRAHALRAFVDQWW